MIQSKRHQFINIQRSAEQLRGLAIGLRLLQHVCMPPTSMSTLLCPFAGTFSTRNVAERTDRAVQALPFLIETPSQKAHKTSLERRLQEIEEADKVFSRTKVLVEI